MVDARGLSCPVPVKMTLDELRSNPKEVKILVDAMVCVENISRLAGSKGYSFDYTETDEGDYRITLKK